MPDRTAGTLTLWRAYVPAWAHLPLSGEGAARFGGRWNPVGQPTIYAALEISTAWAEYNQGFVQHPATIAQLELTGARLADLTDAAVLRALDTDDDIHRCEWRAALDAGETPATHRLQARLIGDYHGVIYPSFMSKGGTCLALWRWNESGAPELRIVDPESRLPARPHRGSNRTGILSIGPIIRLLQGMKPSASKRIHHAEIRPRAATSVPRSFTIRQPSDRIFNLPSPLLRAFSP